jgi:septal ring factor EnvC (AmiA/AmiB activator)
MQARPTLQTTIQVFTVAPANLNQGRGNMKYLLVVVLLMAFVVPAIAQDKAELTRAQSNIIATSNQVSGQLSYIEAMIEALYKDKFRLEEQQTKLQIQFNKVNAQLSELLKPSEAANEPQTTPDIVD